MSIRRPIPQETRRRQWTASDPSTSAWVSAHAGSGKTHVLARRVVRLLLKRVAPSRILCLTYTKAAAANMSARVFDVLSTWALLDDDALDRAVFDVSGENLTPSDRDLARRLFARAVETPDGLKIQTIHAFCEKVLHLFPFEANAPAGFRVLDDIERLELIDQARQTVLERAMAGDNALAEAAAEVARHASGATIEQLLTDWLSLRDSISAISPETRGRALQARLGLAATDSLAAVHRRIIEEGLSPQAWPALADRLNAGGARDNDLAGHFQSASALYPQSECIDAYLKVFFTEKGTPRGGDKPLVSKKLAEGDPDLAESLANERARLIDLVEKRKSAAVLARSLALARLGDAIAMEYGRLKIFRSRLDFDDMIERVRELLRRSNPSWVLYKLDGQIDHILLDEAQDTSAAQWEILQIIANEFTQAVERRGRTFFAVGDEKQSIFSFQGAAPQKFDAMRRDFQRRFRDARLSFAAIPLHLSFRSAPAILAAVDLIFATGDHRRGLSFAPDEPAPNHAAWKSDAAGLIEIWPVIGPSPVKESRDWRLPIDFADEADPAVCLAGRVAKKVASLIAPESGEWVEGEHGPRQIEAGDIIILVRRRNAFFEAMIRALKERRIPVAGADRLDLADHIAVMDLCALGWAALLPDDDLTFATLLKSPLVGLDDDDLIALAPGRPGALVDALRASNSPRHQAAARRFETWRRDVSEMSPFDFYAKALGADGGRERLIARLGTEASDAIDEFLRLALGFERDDGGSLTQFLAMVSKLELSIKRDMEAAGAAVRVMTVHAAKGLEAKVVFLPDTCGAPASQKDTKIFMLDDDENPETASFAWSPRKDEEPAVIAAAREKRELAAQDEYRRLLYVALTRAEERLYIGGYHGKKGPAKDCWYEMIRTSLAPVFNSVDDPDRPSDALLRNPDAPAKIMLARPPSSTTTSEMPLFARTPAPREPAPEPPLRPSSALSGVDATPALESVGVGRRDGEALLIGRLTHALLQHLPSTQRESRRAAGLRFLESRAPRIEITRRESILSAVLSVLEDESLAPLFGETSLAEVDIVARIETRDGPRDLVGRIDRLAECGDQLFLADFKTGRPRRTLSPAHLRQLALYRAALAPLYPGKKLRCFLVWTQDASLCEADEAQLDAALADIG